MNAVDTNILVYSIDDREPFKQAKAQQCLAALGANRHGTVLLWQVLCEFMNQLRRWRNIGLLTGPEYLNHVQAYRRLFPLALPATGVVDHAIRLVQQLSLSHWDSLILGACRHAAVTTLYTEDMGSPTNIDGIELINPLL